MDDKKFAKLIGELQSVSDYNSFDEDQNDAVEYAIVCVRAIRKIEKIAREDRNVYLRMSGILKQLNNL